MNQLTDIELTLVIDTLDTRIESHQKRMREIQNETKTRDFAKVAKVASESSMEYMELKNRLLVMRRAREKLEYATL